MMKIRTNYIIAGWTGPRRTDQIVGTHYIDAHLDRLATLKHSLSQITIVIPFHQSLTFSMKRKLTCRNRIGSTPIVYLFKENMGLSYGSWSHGYLQTRGNFDYFFFTEDDYVYVADNFDTVMVKMFGSIPRCGYLCTLVKDFPQYLHAAISNGMSSHVVLEQIVKKHGRLLYYDGPLDQYVSTGQLDFSRAFTEAGYELADITHKYRAPYWHPTQKLLMEFAPNNEEYLIKPIQMISEAFANA